MIKSLRVLSLIFLLGISVLNAMEQCVEENKEKVITSEIPSIAYLPKDVVYTIISLYMEKELSYNYDLLSKIQVKSAAQSVAFSSDGKIILIRSQNETYLWSVEKGKQLQKFEDPHNYPVWAVALSPDGKSILAGSYNKEAWLWDIKSGRQVTFFIGHTQEINSVAFSPDGNTVLTGSSDTTARLWDVQTGKQLKVFTGHKYVVQSVAFSSDGETILTGSNDKTARLWDVKSGAQLKAFRGRTGYVYLVAFSPDGKTILTGSNGIAVQLWDRESGKQIKYYIDFVSSVAFSPDGKTILTGSFDDTAQLWDVESGERIKAFGDQGSIKSVAFSKDGEMIATGSCDGSVIIYRRYKESEEKTKDRLKQRPEAALKLYKEKELQLLLRPTNTSEEVYSENSNDAKVEGTNSSITYQEIPWTTASSSIIDAIDEVIYDSEKDLEKDAPKECLIQ